MDPVRLDRGTKNRPDQGRLKVLLTIFFAECKADGSGGTGRNGGRDGNREGDRDRNGSRGREGGGGGDRDRGGGRGGKGVSLGEIARKCGLSRKNTLKHLNALVEAGYIVKEGSRRGAVYTLTEEGRKAVDEVLERYNHLGVDYLKRFFEWAEGGSGGSEGMAGERSVGLGWGLGWFELKVLEHYGYIERSRGAGEGAGRVGSAGGVGSEGGMGCDSSTTLTDGKNTGTSITVNSNEGGVAREVEGATIKITDKGKEVLKRAYLQELRSAVAALERLGVRVRRNKSKGKDEDRSRGRSDEDRSGSRGRGGGESEEDRSEVVSELEERGAEVSEVSEVSAVPVPAPAPVPVSQAPVSAPGPALPPPLASPAPSGSAADSASADSAPGSAPVPGLAPGSGSDSGSATVSASSSTPDLKPDLDWKGWEEWRRKIAASFDLLKDRLRERATFADGRLHIDDPPYSITVLPSGNIFFKIGEEVVASLTAEGVRVREDCAGDVADWCVALAAICDSPFKSGFEVRR